MSPQGVRRASAEPFLVVCSMHGIACFAHLATLRVMRCALEPPADSRTCQSRLEMSGFAQSSLRAHRIGDPHRPPIGNRRLRGRSCQRCMCRRFHRDRYRIRPRSRFHQGSDLAPAEVRQVDVNVIPTFERQLRPHPTLVLYTDDSAPPESEQRLRRFLIDETRSLRLPPPQVEYAEPIAGRIAFSEGYRLYKSYLSILGLLEQVYDEGTGFVRALR